MSRLPRVRDLMETDHHSLDPDMPIVQAIRELIEHGITGAPVVDANGRVYGVLSELDGLRLLARGDADLDIPQGTVRDHMDKFAPIVEPRMDVYYVAGLFLRDPTRRRFPVCEDGRLVGVITRKDILKVVEKHHDSLY
jgi:CBS domain-containing protein